MKKILAILALVFLQSTAYAFSLKHCQLLKSHLQSGDLVFLELDNYVFKQVALLTQSWTSHVGIAFYENHEWIVYESVIPFSKRTPLCDYMNKTKGDSFEVKRLPGLTDVDIQSIKQSAESRLGIAYNIGFDYDSHRQFCSKFVYDVFKEALGLEVGQKETFQDLKNKNPNADLSKAEIWFLGNIPWDRVTVTPASVYEDPKLVFVDGSQ